MIVVANAGDVFVVVAVAELRLLSWLGLLLWL